MHIAVSEKKKRKKKAGIDIIINDVKPNLSNNLMDQLQVYPVLSLLSCSTFTCVFFLPLWLKRDNEHFMAGMVPARNKHFSSDQCEKAAILAEALKLLQLKPQEALQVKSYILDSTQKQSQRGCKLQKIGLGADHGPDMRYGYMHISYAYMCIWYIIYMHIYIYMHMIYMDIYAYIHTSTTNYIWV